jgi:hypothetical protein
MSISTSLDIKRGKWTKAVIKQTFPYTWGQKFEAPLFNLVNVFTKLAQIGHSIMARLSVIMV